MNWNGDGSVKDTAEVLTLLGAALDELDRSTVDTARLQDAIVSVARDAAQAAVVAGTAPADWAALIANADRAWPPASCLPSRMVTESVRLVATRVDYRRPAA